MMENVLFGLIMGIGLSAACVIKVFIPMLILCLGARTEYLTLGENWGWLASDGALAIFLTAMIIEICAYYIPALDHLMDLIEAPAAAIAGTVAASAMFVDMSPLMDWTLAIIAGGGASTAVHVGKSVLRGVVSVPTLGTGNWAFTTGEVILSAGMGIVSVVLPIVGLCLICGIIGGVVYFKHLRSRRGNRVEVIPA